MTRSICYLSIHENDNSTTLPTDCAAICWAVLPQQIQAPSFIENFLSFQVAGCEWRGLPQPGWRCRPSPWRLSGPCLGSEGFQALRALPRLRNTESVHNFYGKNQLLLLYNQSSLTTPCYGNGPRFFGARSRISRKEDAPTDLPTTDRPTHPPLDRPGISDHGLNKMRTWKNICLDKAKLWRSRGCWMRYAIIPASACQAFLFSSLPLLLLVDLESREQSPHPEAKHREPVTIRCTT